MMRTEQRPRLIVALLAALAVFSICIAIARPASAQVNGTALAAGEQPETPHASAYAFTPRDAIARPASAQDAELRLETPAEIADAAEAASEGKPRTLEGWAQTARGEVWLEPYRHAYYPDRDLVLDKQTGEWFQPVRKDAANAHAMNPYRSPSAPAYAPAAPAYPANCPTCPQYQPIAPAMPYYPQPPAYPQVAPNSPKGPRPWTPPTYPAYDYGPYGAEGCRNCGLQLGESLAESFAPIARPIQSLVR